MQDKLSESYYPYSPYNYVLNNPTNAINPDGNFVVTGAVILGFTIYELAIMATAATVATKTIVDNVQESSTSSYSRTPGHREGRAEQQKREGDSQRETSQIKQNHAKSVDNNVGKPTPDGSSTPKGGGSTIAKVVAGAGFASEFMRACNETTGGNNQNSSSESQSSGSTETTISQGPTSESTSSTETNTTFTLPVYTLPSDNAKLATPKIIPLKIDEKN